MGEWVGERVDGLKGGRTGGRGSGRQAVGREDKRANKFSSAADGKVTTERCGRAKTIPVNRCFIVTVPHAVDGHRKSALL